MTDKQRIAEQIADSIIIPIHQRVYLSFTLSLYPRDNLRAGQLFLLEKFEGLPDDIVDMHLKDIRAALVLSILEVLDRLEMEGI